MDEITRIYMGKEGCRCGCRGEYAEPGDPIFKKRVKRFMSMWKDYKPQEDDVDPCYRNISYGMDRVMTVYFG